MEIDPDTGVVAVVRYACIDDLGRVINPMIVEGQIQGALAQGIGQALMEHVVYDKGSGQLVSGSFMDYAMPRATDMPPFEIAFHNVPAKTNPLGVKGIGEAGCTGSPAGHHERHPRRAATARREAARHAGHARSASGRRLRRRKLA